MVAALRPETSIGEAVARAGGVTPTGNRGHVRVLRMQANGQQEQFIVNLSDPSSTAGTMPVKSGDQIVVDRKRSFTKDILIPALGIIGSVASVGLLIDRINNGR
jgi:hypothetical protein